MTARHSVPQANGRALTLADLTDPAQGAGAGAASGAGGAGDGEAPALYSLPATLRQTFIELPAKERLMGLAALLRAKTARRRVGGTKVGGPLLLSAPARRTTEVMDDGITSLQRVHLRFTSCCTLLLAQWRQPGASPGPLRALAHLHAAPWLPGAEALLFAYARL